MWVIKSIKEYFIFLIQYLLNFNNYRMYKGLTNYLKSQGEEVKTGIKDYFLFSLGICLNDLDEIERM